MEKNELFNYIVPIYQDKEFMGTGFFVSSYLITAAHVINMMALIENQVSYYYKDCKQILKLCDVQFHNNDLNPDKFCDVAIIEQKSINSPIELASEIDYTSKGTYMGYSYDEERHLLRQDLYDELNIKDESEYNTSGVGPKNCFISYPPTCKEGNSGGPLFQGIQIVGLLKELIKSPYKVIQNRYIKSSYILNILNNLKS